jgi:predicted dehydrogenase
MHKILVIGKGFWGGEWIKALETSPHAQLVDAVTRDYAAALKSIDADIVAVVTPPPTHMEVIRAAFEAGKHVICEKPLADTWEACLAIADLVRAYPDLSFMVAQTRRFVPQVQTVKQLIASGRLGKVNTIKFDHTVYDPDGGWRLELFSPVLDDMSTHHFDAFRYMTGQEPVSVYAEGWNPPWSQYPSNASHNILIRMTDDIYINYFATWSANGKQNSYDGLMQIMGEKGSLELVDPDTLLFYEGRSDTETSPAPQRIDMVDLPEREIGAIIHVFTEALDKKTLPPCTIDDNIKTMAMTCAAIESCKTDRRVSTKTMLKGLER